MQAQVAQIVQVAQVVQVVLHDQVEMCKHKLHKLCYTTRWRCANTTSEYSSALRRKQNGLTVVYLASDSVEYSSKSLENGEKHNL